MTGMRIRFDDAFDGAVWPGPLGPDGRAVFGDTWVGPRGLLQILETMVGLAGNGWTDIERAAAIVPHLQKTEGYWSASLEADAIGTARRLLADRDALWTDGWRGQPVSERLAELHRATADVRPGRPDRILRVVQMLARRSVDIERIELSDGCGPPPTIWRTMLDALRASGVRIADAPTHRSAPAEITMFRPHGPLAAAESVAAWLASRSDEGCVVIVGGDATLDRAFGAHGLPTTGAHGGREGLLSVLPLVLELGWDPADPQQAYELLSLRGGPVPPAISGRLIRALGRWPAVGSQEWAKALNDGLARIEDEVARDKVARRIASVFSTPAAGRGGLYPFPEIVKRTTSIADWARARGGAAGDDGGPWIAVYRQCQSLLRLLEAAGASALRNAELRRWVRIASDEVGAIAPHPAQAGIHRVLRPDAIDGPADTVVWWDFHRGAAVFPRRVVLAAAERVVLTEAGVVLNDPAQVAVDLAHRWRRPHGWTQDRLVFVCPQRGEDGDRLYPHPLWDELETERKRPTVRELPAETVQVSSSPLVSFSDDNWRAPPGTAMRRDRESPSSIEKLVGCSLRWALEYFGGLFDGLASPPPTPGPLVYGSVAHEAFRAMLDAQPASEADAIEALETFLDVEAKHLAAELFVPGREFERGELRYRLMQSARILWKHIRERQSTVVGTEAEYKRAFLDTELAGRVDLVLAHPGLVVDYKWGSRDAHRLALQEGTSTQLAAYSFLVGEWPAVTYFVLRSHDLLEPNVQPDVTWAAVEAAVTLRLLEIRQGVLRSPGDDDTKPAIVDGTLTLPSPCRYCSFDVLCGKGVVS